MYDNIRKYEFKGKKYTAEEMEKIIKEHSNEQVHIAVNYRILSRILSKGGMPKLAAKIAKLATLFESSITGYYSTGTERQQTRDRNRYNKKTERLGKVEAFTIHNNQSYLPELIYETLGHVPLNGKDVKHSSFVGIGSVIDYMALSKEECIAIARNFKRDMKGEKRIPYQGAPKLR